MRATTRETDCLAALDALKVHEADLSFGLDSICRTAARLFNVPVAFVSVIDASTIWLKGRSGLGLASMPRASSPCDRAVRLAADEALVVPDLSRDSTYATNLMVAGEPHVRFYAGVPIALDGGLNIGTFCILDRVPRTNFGADEIAELHDLARNAEVHLKLRAAHLSGLAQAQERIRVEALLAVKDNALREVDRRQRIAELIANFGHWRIDGAGWTISWSEGMARIFGRTLPASGSLDLEEYLALYQPEDGAVVRKRLKEALGGRDLQDDGSFRGGGRIHMSTGEERQLVFQGMVERDDTGSVLSLYGISVDVTDLARSERSARETAALLRTTLENIDQGLIMLGPDQRVRVFNDRARDILMVPDEMLYPDAPWADIRRYLFEAVILRQVADAGLDAFVIGLERTPERRERVRADGMIVEVRAMPLADGGVVRTYADVTQRRETERAVRESERRFRLLAESTTDVVIWANLDNTRRYVSPAAKVVLGYEPEELVGGKPIEIVHPDDIESVMALFEDLRCGRIENFLTTQRYRRKDGRYIWIEGSCSPARDGADGSICGFVGSLRDVSDRKRVEEDLRISEERLAMALDSGSDGLFDLDVTTGAIRLTGQCLSIMGCPEGESVSHLSAWRTFTHPDDLPRAKSCMTDHFKGLIPKFESEYRIRAKTGSYVWISARGKVVARDESGRALRMVGTHIDITKRKEAEALIEHMALHDPLTGLPNRNLFQDRLGQELADLARNGGCFAVLACDLDRFKVVNDTLGHGAGDALLRGVAARLSSIVREGDTVARLGGDEFAIILRHIDQPQEASAIATRIIEEIEQPSDADGCTTSVGISIGIAVASGRRSAVSAENLFKNADLALYRAKAEGRNTYRFFEAGMDALVAERNILERDLRTAVKRGSFELNYQPIVDLASNVVCGFEALLRWQHPTRGVVPPAEFISLAEETRLIVPLGEWALREACRQAALWPKHLRMAVNVSAVQFQQPHTLQHCVLTALADSGLAPDRLELEVTESVLIQDAEAVIACLHCLRELGVRVALDDFGTGYSSLGYLRRFPFHKIKIDRTFVRDIANPDTAAIVRAVVGLGVRVNADITAEGVETVEQREHMSAAGCTQMQGFLFSMPLPADKAATFAARRNALAAA